MTDTAKRAIDNVAFKVTDKNGHESVIDREKRVNNAPKLQKRYLKIRLQGTKNDLKWFRRILERSKQVKVLDISEPFENKGTNKYYRVYVDVTRKEEE